MTHFLIKQSPYSSEFHAVAADAQTLGPVFHSEDDTEPTRAQMRETYKAWCFSKAPNATARLNAAHNLCGVIVQGVRLACGPEDRAKFSQLLVMLREAEHMQPPAVLQAFLDSPVNFLDGNGTLRTLSVTDFRSLMFAYGTAYNALWTAASV